MFFINKKYFFYFLFLFFLFSCLLEEGGISKRDIVFEKLSSGDIQFGDNVLFDDSFAYAYGVVFSKTNSSFIIAGNASFPELKWGARSSETAELVLIYEGESDKAWGHGIWLLDKNITNILRKDGVTKVGTSDIVNASLSEVDGVEVIESYYAPRVSLKQYIYTFYLFSINNKISRDNLVQELNKVKSNLNNRLFEIGVFGEFKGPRDRISYLRELLGDKIIEESFISAKYPK